MINSTALALSKFYFEDTNPTVVYAFRIELFVHLTGLYSISAGLQTTSWLGHLTLLGWRRTPWRRFLTGRYLKSPWYVLD